MGTIRREVRIDRPAEAVWAVVGDPTTVHEWFPGVVDSTVDGDIRTITLGSGVSLSEEIVTIDPILRRFQYRIQGGFFRQHLGTIDVLALDDRSCLVVYSTDAEPDVMALVVGGAAGEALHELERRLDATHDPAASAAAVRRAG